MTFRFSAPRYLNYYVLQVFLPIILKILISWFTFFLHDYTRRIEAAGANILLLIAFSWSLADNYPRLGYLTFLDAITMGLVWLERHTANIYRKPGVNSRREAIAMAVCPRNNLLCTLSTHLRSFSALSLGDMLV